MQTNKRWLYGVKIVGFLLILAGMIALLNALVAPKNLMSSKLTAYLRAEDPEVAVMGNSTVLRLYPELIDQASGMDTYQFGSQIQTLATSRYLLQTLIDQGKKPDVLLLYMHIRRLQQDTGAYDATFVQALPWGRSKLAALFHSFTLDDAPEALLPCVYGRELLGEGVRQLLVPEAEETVVPPAWMAEEYATALAASQSKGTEGEPSVVMHDPLQIDIGAYDTFTLEGVSDQALAQFHEIVALCRAHDIRLITFSLPILPGNLMATEGEGYHAFHSYMEELAASVGVPFWDLTYVREDVAVIDSSCFVDARHGNAAFTVRMSRLLGQMLQEYVNGTLNEDAYLYSKYADYLALHRGVNGLYTGKRLRSSKTEKNYVDVMAALGVDTEVELRVSVAPAGSEAFTLFRDWDEERRVVFGQGLPSGRWRVKFEARQLGGEAVEQVLIKEFDVQ